MIDIWNFVAAIGVILGIISSLTAITAYFKTKKIESIIGIAKDWRIDLSLTEPIDSSDLVGRICSISGQVEFIVSTLQFEGNPKINLFLAENNVELFPLVQPLAEGNFWWVQPKPLIKQNGKFDGSIFIGDKQGHGIGVVFQIVVAAVPKGAIKEGDMLKEAPFTYAISNTVKITRIS